MTLSIVPDSRSLNSTFYEQLVEHVFISEVLQECWHSFSKPAEVLRSEVDAYGYDLVIECNNFLRHIQLKTSDLLAKKPRFNVNLALEKKLSGCVVWAIREEKQQTRRMSLRYRFYGDDPGKGLPSLAEFKTARHATAKDAKGQKKLRENIRVVPIKSFGPILSISQLVERLFGSPPLSGPTT